MNPQRDNFPIFEDANSVAPILKSEEMSIKSKIPKSLGLKLPSPLKDLENYNNSGDSIFKEKAATSLKALKSIAKKVPEYLSIFGDGKVDAVKAPEAKIYWVRDNALSENDLSEAKAILFGEISNRSSDKQQLEAQTILNTAFNRMQEYNARKFRGNDNWTLAQVLQEPNQYQAYKSKQYEKYKSGNIEELDKRKIKSIDDVIKQVQNGQFQNNIDTRTRYHHEPDGRIIVTDEPLFK